MAQPFVTESGWLERRTSKLISHLLLWCRRTSPTSFPTNFTNVVSNKTTVDFLSVVILRQLLLPRSPRTHAAPSTSQSPSAHPTTANPTAFPTNAPTNTQTLDAHRQQPTQFPTEFPSEAGHVLRRPPRTLRNNANGDSVAVFSTQVSDICTRCAPETPSPSL